MIKKSGYDDDELLSIISYHEDACVRQVGIT